jgi:hypothetical protein
MKPIVLLISPKENRLQSLPDFRIIAPSFTENGMWWIAIAVRHEIVVTKGRSGTLDRNSKVK